jgi:carbonic anhydrase
LSGPFAAALLGVTMKVERLFANNRKWARGIKEKDPRFFERLSCLQKPQYLWIGCSDSRVPANEIVGLLPGELFVHRNVANIVYLDDLNCLSVLQYAIQILKVKNIIICGHYNCGGVKAVAESKKLGDADVWLRSIREVRDKYGSELAKIKSREQRADRLCELNVLEQAEKACRIHFVRKGLKRGKLSVHAWIYNLRDGLIRELRRYPLPQER